MKRQESGIRTGIQDSRSGFRIQVSGFKKPGIDHVFFLALFGVSCFLFPES
jgi:hypothetical protein